MVVLPLGRAVVHRFFSLDSDVSGRFGSSLSSRSYFPLHVSMNRIAYNISSSQCAFLFFRCRGRPEWPLRSCFLCSRPLWYAWLRPFRCLSFALHVFAVLLFRIFLIQFRSYSSFHSHGRLHVYSCLTPASGQKRFVSKKKRNGWCVSVLGGSMNGKVVIRNVKKRTNGKSGGGREIWFKG